MSFSLLLQLVDIRQWSLEQFFFLTVANVALNQTWGAIVVWFFLTFDYNTHLYTLLSAVAGFFSGFLIPISSIPIW